MTDQTSLNLWSMIQSKDFDAINLLSDRLEEIGHGLAGVLLRRRVKRWQAEVASRGRFADELKACIFDGVGRWQSMGASVSIGEVTITCDTKVADESLIAYVGRLIAELP